MPTALMPEGRQRYFNNDGSPCAGGKLWTYSAGTTNPRVAYADEAGTTPLPNPIPLDAKGEAVIYWSGAYKVDLKQADGAQVTGYPVDNIKTDPGNVWGWRGELLAADGAKLVGFLLDAGGAGLRTVWAKLRDAVNLADFTPAGDGVTNDTAILAAADAYAASRGVALHIPKPAVAYFGNGFRPTTDWICEPGTVFLNSNRAALNATAYNLFVVEHDVTIANAIVDANRINTVTGTPDIAAGAWAAANFDKFTGGIAIVVQSGAKPTLINCTGRNSGGHPAWHMTNSSPKLYRCKANGARGNFGDGFYMGTCTNAVLEDCASDDVTRINFCTEDKSAGIKLVRPVATNAHDAGKNYGGTEFNASIWMEHTVGSAVEDPDCDNALIIGGASKWLGDARAPEPINVRGGRSGSMQMSSVTTDLFDVYVRGHKSGQLTFGILGAGQVTTLDGVHLIGGGASVVNLNGALRCDGEVGNTTLRLLNSTLQVPAAIDSKTHGHIAFNTKTPNLAVENTKGIDSAGNDVPLTLGFLNAAPTTLGAMRFRNVDITMWGDFYCGAIAFDGRYSLTCDNNVNMVAPVYFGPNGAIKTNVVANANRLFIYKDITVRGKVQNVRLRMIGDAAKSIADFRQASFEYDMSVFQPAVFYQEQNWAVINFAGATFRHTGAAAPLANNYWLENGAAAGVTFPILAGNTFASTTVANIAKHSTIWEDPGFTKVAI